MSELEFDILNAVTKHSKIALEFVSYCDESMFLDETNKRLAKTFLNYIKSFKSKPTRRVLLERFASDNNFVSILNSFFDNAEKKDYNIDEYNHDIQKLKREFGQFKLERLKKQLLESPKEDVLGNVKIIQKEISDIKAIDGIKSFNRSTFDGFVDQFRSSYIDKVKSPELGRGLLTGYSMLDYIKNGLRPSDLIIIAGETGSGKSLFMSNIAVQMWLGENTIDTPPEEFKKGCNVVYFSLEMPYEDCFQRAMARIADVPSYGIRDAKLSKFEAQGVSKACKFMKKYPYKFEIVDVPRGLTVDQMEIIFQEIKNDYNPDVVFIDYLGLMEDASEGSEDWLTLGKLAGRVHELGRTYSIPIVTAVQLNRMDPGQRGNQSKAIGLHRIGRSALIATHATLIIQIETRQDEQTHDDFNYHIIKNRHGESGGHASVYKNPAKCSIIDTPYDTDSSNMWANNEDISDDVSEIFQEVL